jgi:lipopolysaccharide heptosyltransferase III
MRRLILRPGAIGDCILSLPAIQHLVADYTEIWISTPVVPLISFVDSVRPLSSTGIDKVALSNVEVPRKLLWHLKSFDSIVSWYGTNRPEFQGAIRSLGPHCVFLAALPPDDFRDHAGQFFARQVGADEGLVPRIRISTPSQRDSVAIHPFSGSKRKNWPLERYQTLARRLSPRKVEWIVGPEEQLEGAHRFEKLDELAAWLGGAKLYIGNDSGITHLAAALGIPTLALFGPTDPARWAPRGENVRVLYAPAITELCVEGVLEMARAMSGHP